MMRNPNDHWPASKNTPRRQYFLIAMLALLIVGSIFSCAKTGTTNDPAITASRGVLTRVLGERADDFVLKKTSASSARDEFEISAQNGKVEILGNSAVALTRGAYFYLRHAGRTQVAWSGKHLGLPEKLPDYAQQKIASPFLFRLYYNVCSFGYTTAFWDWPRWKRELDWMALHGINMPLALIGQEAVWRDVWKSYGITDAELATYFSGPAFLPWHRMGNINRHDGPLPQSWLDGKSALQKKILQRMRELGMTPVVPAFSGFVPKALKRVRPSAELRKLNQWAGFDQKYGTFILSPLSPLFQEIGEKFIREYTKRYGTDHYYLADSFNELDVPLSKANRYEELADYGDAVYKSIIGGDPDGTWLMMGWLFYNRQNFWDKASVQALLQKVPDDRMIIIDLANERFSGWKAHDAFYGKKWIYSIIHNFGGRNRMFGDIEAYSRDFAHALNDPKRGKLIGFGLSPEGIENNEVIYELLTDAAWRHEAIDVSSWIENYCLSRYDAYPPEMQEAWQILLQTVYRQPNGKLFDFQRRPSLNLSGSGKVDPRLEQAAHKFLACAKGLADDPLYRNDLVNIVGQCCAMKIDQLLENGIRMHKNGQFQKREVAFKSAFDLLQDLDNLMAYRADKRLETWVDAARQWGKDNAEKDYYESDAKRQVTVWGGPGLSEYAAKVWSGLIRDYYAGRWKLFYNGLKSGHQVNIKEWEEKWITTPGNLTEQQPVDDPVSASARLLQKIDKIDSL